MRSIGLDVGDKRIGVAMCDPEGILASPLTTIARGTDDEATIDTVMALAERHGVEKIVIGMPYSMSGDIGTQASKVMDFITKLSKRTEISIETWDERLSTVAVQRLMATANQRGKAARLRRDAAAAAYILQGYLDRLKVSDK